MSQAVRKNNTSSTWSLFTGQSSSSPPRKRKRKQQTNSEKDVEIFHDCIEIMSSDDEGKAGSSNTQKVPPSSSQDAQNPSSDSNKQHSSASRAQNNPLTGQPQKEEQHINTATQAANSHQCSQDATTSVSNQESTKASVVSAAKNAAMTVRSHQHTAGFHGAKDDTSSSEENEKSSIGSTTSKQSIKSSLATAPATTPRNRDDRNHDSPEIRDSTNNEGQTSKVGSSNVIDLLSSDEDEEADDRNNHKDQKVAAKSRTPYVASASSAKSPKNQDSNTGKKEKKRVQPFCLMPRKKVPPIVANQTSSTNQEANSVSRRSHVGLSTSKTPPVARSGQTGVGTNGKETTNKRKVKPLGSTHPAFQSNDDNSSNRTPSLDELKSKCWKCLVQLRMDETSEEMCCYAMHTHPLFEVPVCCVCSREVAAVEADHESDQEEDSQFCSGCGTHEDELDILLICDKCHRGMCKKCVSQSYGGGSKGDSLVSKLMNEDESWYGPCCLKPPGVKRLMQDMEKYAQQEAPERTDQHVLNELDIVESKKSECEEWDREENLQRLESSIRDELASSIQDSSDIDQLEEDVANEMKRWYKHMEQHEERLADLAASLHEELEKRNVDLKALYKEMGHLDNASAEEAPWKRAADEENAKRALEWKHQPPEDSSDDESDSSSLSGMEVEDLWDDFPDDDADADFQDAVQRRKADGWRNSDRATKRQIERSLKKENERYFNRLKVKKFAEAEDAMEIIKEESETFSSVSKVRRDDLIEKPRRKEMKRIQKKRRHSRAPSDERRPSQTRKYQGAESQTNGINSKIVENLFDPRRGDQCVDDSEFSHSSLVLSGSNNSFGARQISIAEPLAKILKKHQREGISFMWKRAFSDLLSDTTKSPSDSISGVILAHNMGLGKSLSSVALIETLLNSPALNPRGSRGRIHTILLVVPVNTISNWENEFKKWTDRPRRDRQTVEVFGLQGAKPIHRLRILESWARRGGVLLVAEKTFLTTLKKTAGAASYLQKPGPCALFLDEAHSMLKNSNNEVYKALAAVATKRRICLTGSPFQNDLCEYYRLVNYVCPGVFGDSEKTFTAEFAEPIRKGLVSDATVFERAKSEDLLQVIEERVEPFVHRRKDSLQEVLPPMQEVTLFLRKSQVQARLVSTYKKNIKSSQFDYFNSKNFFAMYQTTKMYLNHPAALFYGEKKLTKMDAKKEAEASKPSSKPVDSGEDVVDLLSDSELEIEREVDSSVASHWWTPVVEKFGKSKFEEVESGYKVPLLLHILVAASIEGEKVVVFSQCLKTLSFLEHVLGMTEWEKHVPSLTNLFPGQKNGGWQNGRDYLRLDGSSQAEERGMMIGDFNSESNDRIRLFLISIRAGCLGINLCSATRVVLFDTPFNPVLSNQAWHRTYRLGQENPVFVYRFITQGTMEEKIYKKAENKTSLGERVIDSKNFIRQFSRKEVEDLSHMNDWVQCDECEKWRMIPPMANVDASKLPEKWCCDMNEWDRDNSRCSDPERDDAYYARHFSSLYAESGDAIMSPSKGKSNTILDESKEKQLLARDVIMQKLTKISAKDKKSKIVSKFKYGLYTRLDDEATLELKDVPVSQEVEEVTVENGKLKDSPRTPISKGRPSCESPKIRKKPASAARKSPRRSEGISTDSEDDMLEELLKATYRSKAARSNRLGPSSQAPAGRESKGLGGVKMERQQDLGVAEVEI